MKRFDVYLVNLEPTFGREMRKTRPGLIVSPDEMNRHIGTVIIAPMTSKSREYPSRISITFRKKRGQVVLDQLRTVDKRRLVKRLGKVDKRTSNKVLHVLREMFSP